MALGPRFARALLGFVLVPSFCACEKPRGEPALAASAPAASAPVATELGRKGLDAPTAFELVPSADGATLLFAPADARPGALVAVELASDGAPKAPPRPLVAHAHAPGEISDLTAVWVKHELALAWVERAGARARVRAAWASTARVFELGGTFVPPRTARGNVSLAAREGAALVFARGDAVACIEPGQHGCFGFSFHELQGDRAVPTGLPLAVPVPCTDHSTALAVGARRWHYGVCTGAGEKPVTTMFTIQREPAYARADRLLEGCEPEGTFGWDGAAWLVGSCEGKRRAVRLGNEPEEAEYFELGTARLECAGGAVRVRAPALDLPLTEPRAALQTILPPELAPRGARAVWSGRALLIASTLGAELRLTATTCHGDTLKTRLLDSASAPR